MTRNSIENRLTKLEQASAPTAEDQEIEERLTGLRRRFTQLTGRDASEYRLPTT